MLWIFQVADGWCSLILNIQFKYEYLKFLLLSLRVEFSSQSSLFSEEIWPNAKRNINKNDKVKPCLLLL